MATVANNHAGTRQRASKAIISTAIDKYLSDPDPLVDQINERLEFRESRHEANTHFGVKTWQECHLDGGVQRVTVDTTSLADVPTILAAVDSRSEVRWEAELVQVKFGLDQVGILRQYATYEVVEIV